MQTLTAGFWGGVAGASLVVGALIGVYMNVPRRVIGLVMAFGAGVLISSVSFELMEKAYVDGGFYAAGGGLIFGAIVFFALDAIVNRLGARHRKRSDGRQAKDGGNHSAKALVIGSLLDGIPESIAIGISLLSGGSVSAVMVAAVFLSNVPESLSAAVGMKKAGRSTKYILILWAMVMITSALAAAGGNLFLENASGHVIGVIEAFAAGAILTMLASTMMPEAYEEGGEFVGLVTTVGFLVAFVLSKMEG